jgi:hypothetical protein
MPTFTRASQESDLEGLTRSMVGTARAVATSVNESIYVNLADINPRSDNYEEVSLDPVEIC